MKIFIWRTTTIYSLEKILNWISELRKYKVAAIELNGVKLYTSTQFLWLNHLSDSPGYTEDDKKDLNTLREFYINRDSVTLIPGRLPY